MCRESFPNGAVYNVDDPYLKFQAKINFNANMLAAHNVKITLTQGNSHHESRLRNGRSNSVAKENIGTLTK